MIQKVFCIYDAKVEAFMSPFYAVARGAAIRSFIEVAGDKTHNIGKYPSDFTLFELGEYDDSNAKFTMKSSPYSLGTALELLPKE